MDDDSEKKKAKGTKKSVMKRRLMFENYKDCLFNDKIILQQQQGFKSDCQNVYAEQIIALTKIALSSNAYKGLQTFDKITAYPRRTNAFKVYEGEMLLIIDYYKHENEDEIMFGICYNIHTKSTQNEASSYK